MSISAPHSLPFLSPRPRPVSLSVSLPPPAGTLAALSFYQMVPQDIQGWELWPGSPSRSVAARRPELNSLSHRVSHFPKTLLWETLELQCQNEIDPATAGSIKGKRWQ